MAWLYNWAADILCFLVLMSLLETLLPSKKYVRYIRFFAGVVLILVAMQPFLGGLGLAQEIDRYFREFSFQTEVRDIRRDVLGIEEERRQQMFSSGEEAAAADVEAMARESGFIPVRTEVEIEKDAESENYGAVVRVNVVVAWEREDETGSPAAEVQTAPEGQTTAETQGMQESQTMAGELGILEPQIITDETEMRDSQTIADASEIHGTQAVADDPETHNLQAAAGGESASAGSFSGEKTAESESPESAADKKAEISSVKIEVGRIEIKPLERRDPAVSEPEQASDGIRTEQASDAAGTAQFSGLSAVSGDIAELKRKVERFYELEPEDVEIQLERR